MFIKFIPTTAVIAGLLLCLATTSYAQHDDHDGHDHDHPTPAKVQQKNKPADNHDDHDDHDHDEHDHADHADNAKPSAMKKSDDHAEHDDHDDHDHDAHAKDEHAGHDHGPAKSDAHDDHDGHDDHAGHGHDEHEDGPIKLDAQMLKRFDIRTAKASSGKIVRYTTLSGEVVFNADRIAHVTTPVPGIVSKVHASMGDFVTKGQVLASISSRELAALRSELLATRTRWELAKENASRDLRLFNDKVGTERAMLESKQVARDAQIQYALAENALHALGFTHQQIEAVSDEQHNLSQYELTSPITGTITQRHLTLGENIATDSYDPAFIIADTRSVWVNLAVYQRDLALIQPGQQVELKFGHHLPDAAGTIAFISPSVEETTRTATARIVLQNPDSHYRPGLFVTGKVHTQSREANVVVPTAAVVEVENKPSVFIQTDEGLEAQPVTIGQSDQKTVEILDGLKPGQVYVSHNAFALKAQMQKGAFGHAGHAH